MQTLCKLCAHCAHFVQTLCKLCTFCANFVKKKFARAIFHFHDCKVCSRNPHPSLSSFIVPTQVPSGVAPRLELFCRLPVATMGPASGRPEEAWQTPSNAVQHLEEGTTSWTHDSPFSLWRNAYAWIHFAWKIYWNQESKANWSCLCWRAWSPANSLLIVCSKQTKCKHSKLYCMSLHSVCTVCILCIPCKPCANPVVSDIGWG